MCPQMLGGEGIVWEDLDEGQGGSLEQMRWYMIEEMIDEFRRETK